MATAEAITSDTDYLESDMSASSFTDPKHLPRRAEVLDIQVLSIDSRIPRPARETGFRIRLLRDSLIEPSPFTRQGIPFLEPASGRHKVPYVPW